MKHAIIKIIDLIDVPTMLIGSYTLSQVKDVLGVLGLIITISYTAWKWRKEIKEAKLKKNEKI